MEPKDQGKESDLIQLLLESGHYPTTSTLGKDDLQVKGLKFGPDPCAPTKKKSRKIELNQARYVSYFLL